MRDFGVFEQNSQGLRLVTELERRYADFNGLNLCQETLEGLVKHNGPLIDSEGRPLERYRERGVPLAILDYVRRHPLELHTFASLEAQAAAVADDIAYNAHDIDEVRRAGLFGLDDIRLVPLPGALVDEIERAHPNLELPRAIHELSRRVITRFIEDVIAESRRRIADSSVASARRTRKE